MSALDTEFHDFCQRFVRCYCEEIVTGSPEFADHEEPCDQSFDEVFAEFTFRTNSSQDDQAIQHFQLWMQRTSAGVSDSWELAFRRQGQQWILVSAIANSSRTDMLDEVYGSYFKPFFKRIIRTAEQSP